MTVQRKDNYSIPGTQTVRAIRAEMKSRIDLRVQTVLRLIENSFQRPLRLQEMADVVCLSTSRLDHLFKTETGMSPERYLALLRLEAAKRYLETSFRPIKEIAALVGMPDVSHFTKNFKTVFGMTPTEYRNSRLKMPAIRDVEYAVAGSAKR